MRTISIWHCVIALCLSPLAFGQAGVDQFEVSTELNRLISPVNSPEAASFAKYGNTPISLYTGTPQISVPLYVFKGRELNLPFQLSYDASGIKVEQEASQVGLGWNLNLGGRVSRAVNGLPDDYETAATTWAYNSFWNEELRDQIVDYAARVSTVEQTVFNDEADAIGFLEFMRDVNDNRYDTQPDYFTFSAMGYSETFVIDMTNYSVQPLNNPRYKAECFKAKIPKPSLIAVPSIPKWKITTDDGTVFWFEEREYTRTQDDDDSEKSQYGLIKKYVSSWYLTKIVSPLGKDVYEFIYDATEQEWERPGASQIVSRVRNVLDPPPGYTGFSKEMGRNDTRTWLHQKNLSSIKHNGRTIASFSFASRLDTGVPTALTGITLYKDDGTTTLRSFDFLQSYFKESGSTAETAANKARLRLKLDEVLIKDMSGDTENSYSFEYYNQYDVPAINSTSQDYYGYYNGINNGAILYPSTGLDPSITDGADRSVNFSKAINGTLKKITYPTGGYSEFNFEANKAQVQDPTDSSGGYTYQGVASLSAAGGAICSGCWYDPDSYCNTPGCIDTYLEIGGPPVVESVVFSVDNTTTLYLNLSLIGTVANNYGKHVLIFKRNDLTSCDFTPPPASLPFDQVIMPQGGLLIPPEDVVFYNTTAGPDFSISDLTLNVEAGCYQIMLVNPESGSTYNLLLSELVYSSGTTGGTTAEVTKAGVRINNIKDYTKSGALAAQRSYSFSDGQVISQPFYSFLRDDWITYIPPGGSIETDALHPVLYRQTHSSATTGPHIGYGSVTETMVDYTDPTKNASTSYNFNTSHWGNYFDGMFTYYINGKQTANNYITDFSLGKQRFKASKGFINSGASPQYTTKYTEESAYDTKQFFKTEGIYFLQKEEKRKQFFTIVSNPLTSNPYAVSLSLVPGELQASFGGIPVYTHPDPSGCVGVECEGRLGSLSFNIANTYGQSGQLTEQKSTQRGTPFVTTGGGTVGMETVTTYSYYDDPLAADSNYLTQSVTTVKSNGEILKKEIKYPDQLPSEYGSLISANMRTIPVETTTTLIDESVSPALETVLSTRKTSFTGKLPDVVQYAKGDASNLEDRILVTEYRNNNITEVLQPDGTEVSYVWGYDNRYIVAKVVGVPYDTVETTLGISAFSPLPAGLSSSQETALRALSGSMVSTYEYEPLIGVTKMTDERGYSMYYEYDDFQRLVRVKDQDGNILQENNYSLRENN